MPKTKKKHLNPCISSLLDQNCKLVSLKGLQLKWEQCINEGWYKPFLSHSAPPHPRGFDWYPGQMWSLPQAAGQRQSQKLESPELEPNLEHQAQNVSLFLIKLWLWHFRSVFYTSSIWSDIIQQPSTVSNVLSPGLQTGDPNSRSAPLLSDGFRLPRETTKGWNTLKNSLYGLPSKYIKIVQNLKILT